MALLKAEPPEPVRSLGELFAVAHRLERGAAARYAELAARARGVGNPEAAGVFERLADEKRGHAAEVERRSRERTGTAPDPLAARWEPRAAFGEEDEAKGAAFHRLATAYRALSLAVRQEERAFSFWSYLVAWAEDPAVRQAAAAMAEEGLHRAGALRRERRRAFHAERRARVGAGKQRTPPGGSPRAPLRGMASLERELAARLQELAAASMARGDADGARVLRRMSADSEKMAEEAAEAGPPVPADNPGGGDGTPLRAALRLAELAVERYLAAADAAEDEASLLKAQSLAERAIARSVWLERMPA